MGIYDREYSRDDDEPSGIHVALGASAVLTLIVLNVGVAIADMFTDGHWLNRQLSVGPDTLAKPWLWWKFLTYGFAHDNEKDLGHLVFNMVGLWIFGTAVEERRGKKEFLWFYLSAIVFGGLVWALPLRGYQGFMLGASGGVVALLILNVLYDPQRILLLFGVVPLPAWLVGVIVVGSDLLGSRDRMGGNVAYEVHLAGAAFAGLYYWQGWTLSRYLPSFSWLSSVPRQAQRLLRPKPDLRIHHPDDDEYYRDLDEQADRALAKLHELGEAALTPQERQILEDYSRRMRQKLR